MRRILLFDSASRNCSTCMYWESDEDSNGDKSEDDDGFCQRFPPVGEQWAQTKGFHWCGEYKMCGAASWQIQEDKIYKLMPKRLVKKIKTGFEKAELCFEEFDFHMGRNGHLKKSGFGIEELSWIVHVHLQLSMSIGTNWVEKTKKFRESENEFWEYLS